MYKKILLIAFVSANDFIYSAEGFSFLRKRNVANSSTSSAPCEPQAAITQQMERGKIDKAASLYLHNYYPKSPQGQKDLLLRVLLSPVQDGVEVEDQVAFRSKKQYRQGLIEALQVMSKNYRPTKNPAKNPEEFSRYSQLQNPSNYQETDTHICFPFCCYCWEEKVEQSELMNRLDKDISRLKMLAHEELEQLDKKGSSKS